MSPLVELTLIDSIRGRGGSKTRGGLDFKWRDERSMRIMGPPKGAGSREETAGSTGGEEQMWKMSKRRGGTGKETQGRMSANGR